MLSQNLLSIIEARVKQDLEDRRNLFSREVNQIKEKMNFKHSLYSGTTVRLILDAIENEYRVRTAMIWQSFARGLQDQGVVLDKSTSDEVKELLVKMIDSHSSDLLKHYSGLNGILHGSKPPKTSDKLRMAAIERTFTEIDFVCLKHSRPTSPTSSTIVNVHQDYGIIQTGSGSTASLSVTIGTQERHEIEKVIEAVHKLLDERTSLSPEQHTEASELVKDLEGEIQRPKPNKHRIRGALQGLATTVQTIAAAPEAYQLIKGAAALLGLQLP
jgi:HPt (histidine-containing phosphotransfer) domain-containing protein